MARIDEKTVVQKSPAIPNFELVADDDPVA